MDESTENTGESTALKRRETLRKRRLNRAKSNNDNGPITKKLDEIEENDKNDNNPDENKALLNEDQRHEKSLVDMLNSNNMPNVQKLFVTQTDFPVQIFPLQFQIMSRTSEEELHPLLSMPKCSYHTALFDRDICYCCCNQFSSNSVPDYKQPDSDQNSTELVTLLFQTTKQFSNENFQHPSSCSIVGGDSHTWGLGEHNFDGLHLGYSPILSQILMRRYELSNKNVMSILSSSSTTAPRIVQRLLRDLILERKHFQILKDINKIRRRGNTSTTDKKDISSAELHILQLLKISPHHPLETTDTKSQSSILPGQTYDITMQLINDPIDYRRALTILPPLSPKFGGILGQWDSLAPLKERIGPLPNIDDKQGQKRTVLRLSIMRIALTKHPLMCREEMLFVQLKQLYSKYRALFEQNIFSYLAYRLSVLLSEMRTLSMRSSDDVLQDQNLITTVRNLYNDLIGTVPMLLELRESFERLSIDISTLWTELQEARRLQGFASTKAELTTRTLSAIPRTGDQDFLPNLELEEQSWKSHLKTHLSDLPKVIKDIQFLLIEADSQDKSLSTTAGKKSVAALSLIKREGNAKLNARDASRSDFGSVLRNAAEEAETRKSVVECLMAGLTSLVDKGMLPKEILKLTSDRVIDPDNKVSVEEKKRRRQISSYRFYVVIKVNNKILTKTSLIPITMPGLLITFKCNYDLKVLHQPKDLAVDIMMIRRSNYCTPNVLKHRLIARLSLPIPGQHLQPANKKGSKPIYVAGLSSVPSWLEFSSDHLEPAPDSDSCLPWSRPGIASRIDGRLQYSLSYSAEVDGGESLSDYQGIRFDEVAVVAAARQEFDTISGKQKRNVARLDNNPLPQFARERDFQMLLPATDSFDKNDPRNEHIMYSKLMASPKIGQRDYFQLHGGDVSVYFSENEESYSNYLRFQMGYRLRLLVLRDLKPFLFSEPIPLSEKFIRHSQYYRSILANSSPKVNDTSMENDTLNITNGQNGDTDDWGSEFGSGSGTTDPNIESVVSNRAKISEFMNKVRESNIVVARTTRHKTLTTQSVVLDRVHNQAEKMFAVGLLEVFSLIIPAPRRPLKPAPKERSPHMTPSSCDLLVQVVGAKHIPQRIVSESPGTGLSGGAVSQLKKSPSKATTGKQSADQRGNFEDGMDNSTHSDRVLDSPSRRPGTGSSTDLLADLMSIRQVIRSRMFVEVSFQNQTQRTTTMDGSSPIWKQSMRLPFHPPRDDFSVSSLTAITDEVYFSVFDEVIEYDPSKTGLPEDRSSERIERKYIGSFSVPFSTIAKEGRIEGTFRLEAPVFNIGYDTKDSNAGSSAAAARRKPSGLFSFVTTTKEAVDANGETTSEAGGENASVANGVQDQATLSELDWFCVTGSVPSIRVMATLDPLLLPPAVPLGTPPAGCLIPIDRFLASYAQVWLEDIRAVGENTRNRPYKIFGFNSDGLGTFISRYLTAMQPPPTLNTRRGCLHLVNMVPFLSDAQLFIGDVDLWCNMEQVFEMGGGDEEEHGILLHNFLYYLSLARDAKNAMNANLKSTSRRRLFSRPIAHPSADAVAAESVFLVLGRAVPEGDTVYVLLKKRSPDASISTKTLAAASNFLLINPCTGYVYEAGDASCPLLEVACLATPYNIWANIQEEGAPHRMLFDVQQTRCWRPFFGNRFPVPEGGLMSVQRMVPMDVTANSISKSISDNVLQALKLNIRRWRIKQQKFDTTFHAESGQIALQMLTNLEAWKRSGDKRRLDDEMRTALGLQDEDGPSDPLLETGQAGSVLQAAQKYLRERLAHILRTRVLRGYPINIPYTDVDSVIEKVKTLCLHDILHPDVQFVVAVRAFPLIRGLVSLWIFLGTLEGKA